ncbi:hypothetical protein Rs2_37176 [Raphanus sativus]|nr:hypothetical protein Rs2_37176 [Raphanus sativus]
MSKLPLMVKCSNTMSFYAKTPLHIAAYGVRRIFTLTGKLSKSSVSVWVLHEEQRRDNATQVCSRAFIKRFPRSFGSSEISSEFVEEDASKVPPPPAGKQGGSAKVFIGGAAVAVSRDERQKLSELVKSGSVTEKLEESHHSSVEDSAGIGSSSSDGKAETLPEFPASVGMPQSDVVEVQPESDPTPERYTYVSSSNQQESPQENAADEGEKSLPLSSDDDSKTKSDASQMLFLRQKIAQPSSVLTESEKEFAALKDLATEKAPEDGIEREVKTPGSLLKEYNLDGNGSSSAGEQLTNETEALPKSTEGLKDGYMTEDGKLVLDFLDAIHAAEERQSHLEAQVFAEKLRTLKEKYENELRDLRARELMRIEEAAILDKELKREKTKAAAAIKSIQERMEDKLKTEIEQKVWSLQRAENRTVFRFGKKTEAQLALSKAEEMAKAELTAAIVKEKAAQIEKMAEADLNVSKDETLYFVS